MTDIFVAGENGADRFHQEARMKSPVVMAIMCMTDWQSIVEATADMPGRSRSMYV